MLRGCEVWCTSVSVSAGARAGVLGGGGTRGFVGREGAGGKNGGQEGERAGGEDARE